MDIITAFGVVTAPATLGGIARTGARVAVRERQTPGWIHTVTWTDTTWPCWGPGIHPLIERARRRAHAEAGTTARPQVAMVVPLTRCRSCRRRAGTVLVTFPDGHRFTVCAGCAPVPLTLSGHGGAA